MRKILLFLSVAFFALQLNAQRIYVNAAATGTGTGDSWANAFPSLTNALAAATTANEIWIAAGTYRPLAGTTDPKMGTFYMLKATKIFGGFAGTETMLSQRNIVTNRTILSGDLNANDIAANFDSLRSDNVYHIMVCTETGGTCTIDGLTFSGGYTAQLAADPDFNQRGGGIMATAPVEIRNCTFTENFARSGGCVAILDAGASGSIVDKCTFYANGVSSQGTGIFIRSVSSSIVKNCVFRNNIRANRGCIYPITSMNVLVDSCEFKDNNAGADNLSGGFYSWQSSFTLSNCVFSNNKARSGAAIYHDGRDGGNLGIIKKCTFKDNENLGYGGTVYNYIANLEMEDCVFTNNKAGTSAAGMYNGGATVAAVKNVKFEGGTCSFGAATANYGNGTIVTYTDCTFSANAAATSGGAVSVGFLGQVTAKNCTFDINTARFGGAIYMQNDTSALTLENCTFLANTAEVTGGAANFGAGVNVMVNKCFFEGNSAATGGALACSEDSLFRPNVTIMNSMFNLNIANTQGAGFNINNGNVNLSNCLFTENLNLGAGAGGAISNNGSGFLGSSVTARNCTFYGNSAPLGSGVSNWVGDSSSCTYTSQNSIYDNSGNNYEVEAGTPTVFSLGGNLSTDATFATFFTQTKDLNAGVPGFVDLSSSDFHLAPGSICVDGGVADANTPLMDLDGLPRVGAPDKGCYELQYVGTGTQIETIRLQIQPNPTSDYFQLNLEHEAIGVGQLMVYDMAGKVLVNEKINKTAPTFNYTKSVESFPTGTYKAYVRLGDTRFVGMFVVQK